MRSIEFVVPGSIETLTGGYIYDRRIVDGLRSLGWSANVVALDASFPIPSGEALEDARRAFERIADDHIVVIDGLALGGLADVLAAHAKRLKLVALVHHPVSFEIGLYPARAKSLHQLEQASLAQVRRVICTSAWTSRALAEYDVDPTIIHIVEPGTEPATAAVGSQTTTLNILCVATVTSRKGHAVLMDALHPLRKRSWHLHCVGSLERDSECAAALAAQIRALQLGDKVTLHGEVSDERLAQMYSETDIFVLASNLEGYGMALAEALARGIPIVTTPCGAIPETLPDGVGMYVPAGDCDALAAALDRLIGSRILRQQLREHALAARSRLPSWEETSARFSRSLEDLVTAA